MMTSSSSHPWFSVGSVRASKFTRRSGDQ
jgi:hypothetical protein